MKEIHIYTDGGARGNPGKAGAGVVIREDGKNITEFGKYLGDNLTNNYAEYEALILALHEAKKRKLMERAIEVRMDSELIVKQMRGEYKVKDAGLRVQNAQVHKLLENFKEVRFVHIPREENAEADALVNEAIDETM